MKKTIILFIALLAIGLLNIVKAQNKEHVREASYLQIGGDGITMLSLNYDRTIKGSLQGRLGLGFSYAVGDIAILEHNYLVSMPMQANYLIGGGHNFFELSGGITPVYLWETTSQARSEKEFTVVPSFFIGYRHQPRNDGFLFRINIGTGYDREGFHIGLGLGFGFVLN